MKAVYDVAVIGCGRMGGTIDDEMHDYPRFRLPYSHAAAYAACPRTRIVAAADPVTEKRTRFGERYGVPPRNLFASGQEMLARIPLDIVSVTTHAPAHCENALAAIEAGVPAVFCEKPLAVSLHEGDLMVAAAEQRRTITAVGTLRRWNALWNRIKETIDSGEAGKVSQIVQYSGGALLHTESHFFDLGRYLLGNAEPEWAVGHLLGDATANPDGSFPDSAGHGYVRFRNGAEYCLVGMGCLYYEATVVCADAVWRVLNNGDSARLWAKDPEVGRGFTREVPFAVPEPVSATLRAVEEIVACLDRGGNTRCTFRDGLVALEMAMAFHLSHRRGNVRVDWPIGDRALRVMAR